MANDLTGKKLTRHLHDISSKAAMASRELQINAELHYSVKKDDVPILRRELDNITEEVTKMRVVLHNIEAKEHFAEENTRTAQRLLESISADVEVTGTELDKFADFGKILEERPMTATGLLAFLVKDFNLLFRAIKMLPDEGREKIALALKESIKEI